MTLSQRLGDGQHDWWRGALFYQIYPRSFMDSNQDGIGDLAGITARLDHVASLGVDAIWLSPFFTSPMEDFGYDVADYRDVDPMFGTLDDFRVLVDRAHDPALTDNPPKPGERIQPGNPQSYQWQRHNIEQPANLAFLERVRALLDEYPGSTTMGEITGDDQLPTMAAYPRGNRRLHMAYTFDLLGSTGDAAELHDMLALTVLCSLRGSLCLYQGEELGLPEAELAYEDLQDPFGINLWPEVKGRDGRRTPMVWEDAPSGGFCPEGMPPWLPVFARHRPLAVERQDQAPDSLLNRVRQLLKLRADSNTLRQGEQKLIDPAALPNDLFGVIRSHGERHLLCLAHLGRDGEAVQLSPDALMGGADGWHGLPLPGMPAPAMEGRALVLEPGTAAWLELR